jgi:hypothetical protein
VPINILPLLLVNRTVEIVWKCNSEGEPLKGVTKYGSKELPLFAKELAVRC